MHQSERTFTLGTENSQLWLAIHLQNAGYQKEILKDSVIKDHVNGIYFMQTKNQTNPKSYLFHSLNVLCRQKYIYYTYVYIFNTSLRRPR